jgi:hypothetical protein
MRGKFMKMQVAFILLMLLVVAHAQDMVAINSFDGRDVLSGVFYANVKGLPVKFMPSQGGNADVFAAKIGSNHDVLLIQSSTIPVSGFVENALKGKNNTVTVYSSSDGSATNLDLAKKSGASGFIIVGSAYSDSALSVLPYAKLSKYYVILADKDNIAQIKDIVSGKNVIIFGLVDKEVTEALSSSNPQIIGKGEDRYADNILMADKTMKDYNVNHLIMVDGKFLEESMALGDQPILLSGTIIPQPTYDFIKQNVRNDKLVSIMLLGNNLVVPAYDMRERMKQEFASEGLNKTVGIVVKFAQVIPSANTGVMNLDTFNMPAYTPALNISDVAYNTQSGKIMATVSNIGDGAAYFTMEVRVKVNGNDFKSFPVGDAMLIQKGEQKGQEYSFDMKSVTEGNITALVLVKYGVTKASPESFIQKEGPLASINYVDKSNVSVQAANYNAEKKTLSVTLRNLGQQKAYAFSHVTLNLGGAPATISSAGTKELAPGALVVDEFPLALSDADFAANSQVQINVDYGARQGFLVKKGAFMMPLQKEGTPSGSPMVLVGAGILVILLIALLAYFLMGKKSKSGPAAQYEPKEPEPIPSQDEAKEPEPAPLKRAKRRK